MSFNFTATAITADVGPATLPADLHVHLALSVSLLLLMVYRHHRGPSVAVHALPAPSNTRMPALQEMCEALTVIGCAGWVIRTVAMALTVLRVPVLLGVLDDTAWVWWWIVLKADHICWWAVTTLHWFTSLCLSLHQRLQGHSATWEYYADCYAWCLSALIAAGAVLTDLAPTTPDQLAAWSLLTGLWLALPGHLQLTVFSPSGTFQHGATHGEDGDDEEEGEGEDDAPATPPARRRRPSPYTPPPAPGRPRRTSSADRHFRGTAALGTRRRLTLVLPPGSGLAFATHPAPTAGACPVTPPRRTGARHRRRRSTPPPAPFRPSRAYQHARDLRTRVKQVSVQAAPPRRRLGFFEPPPPLSWSLARQ